MSNKGKVLQLLEYMPDYKIGYLLAYLQGLLADESADDDFCVSLVDNYNNSSEKGEFVSLDEAIRLCNEQ